MFSDQVVVERAASGGVAMLYEVCHFCVPRCIEMSFQQF